MNNVTFIIPNRGGERIPYVINNFEKTFKDFFDNISFIIVEQNDTYPFKRGQLFNVALNYVTTEWVGLIDNDIFNIDKFNPIQIYQKFGNKPYVAFNKISQAKLYGENFTVTKTELRTAGFGAFNFMKTEDFKKVNGFSNLCIGWGVEDNILNYKIGFKRYIHTLGHITHPRRVNNEPDLLKSNNDILKKYQAKQIQSVYDGLKQTTYTVDKTETTDNVTKLFVSNINVCNDYKYKALFNSIKNIENRYIKMQETPQSDTIIITMTSWKKRLGNLPTVLDTIFNQTKMPNKIVINLSSEEFPNKEKDIPSNVLGYIQRHDIIEIYWIDGPNTKQWKKIIPTMLRYPNDWIICIDDDRTYWPQFIETLWDKHLQYPNNAITLNRSYKVYGYRQHCGHGTLERAEFYDNFNGIDVDEIRKFTESSDTMFNYLLHKNAHPLIPIDGPDRSKLFKEIEPLRKSVKTGDTSAHKRIWTWLENKYGKVTCPPSSIDNNIVKKKSPLSVLYHDGYLYY